MSRCCPNCDGSGKVLSEETIGLRIKDELLQVVQRTKAPGFKVESHPLVASYLIGSGGHGLAELERKLDTRLSVRGVDCLQIDQYAIEALHSLIELEQAKGPLSVGQELEVRIEEPHALYPEAGIARVNGFVINVDGGGCLVGQKVKVKITKLQRTSARAKQV